MCYFDAGRSNFGFTALIHSLTGFDEDTCLRSIVLMRLTHCVRLPLVNLYKERMAQCPVCNTLFVEAPLGRPLSMQQTRQKNLLPFWLDAINFRYLFSLSLFSLSSFLSLSPPLFSIRDLFGLIECWLCLFFFYLLVVLL